MVLNYYISDLHFGHANIIRLCNRPYNTVQEMDEDLINKWNSVITDDDDVYILGDLIFRADDPEKYLKALKGRLHIIRGNHDKFLNNPGYRRYFESIDQYKELVDNGKRVVLFHFPIAEWNGYYGGAIHLYGHIHNSRNKTSQTMDNIENCYNVGADVLDFVPRTLAELIERG